MKHKICLTFALILILAAAVLPVAARQEESSYNKNLKNCALSIPFYEKYLKPYLDGKSKVGDEEWISLVNEIRLDNGISCGYIASRVPGEDLSDYADDIYDAAYYVTLGLEFKILALENPELADILNEKAKKFIFNADELFAPALNLID